MEWVWIALGAVIVLIVLFAALGRSMRPQVPKTPTTAASADPAARAALPASVAAEIDRLVRENQKIAAIKAYRDATGVGLKEAKDRIDRWMPGTAPDAAAPVAPTSDAATVPDAVRADIDKLVAGGQKIVAIKVLREHTGLGLKESKRIIDHWIPGQSRL